MRHRPYAPNPHPCASPTRTPPARPITSLTGYPRALQAAFKTHRGETLTEAVHGRRLALLRERLLAGSGDDSVTELVHACGFAHLGRAASAYRAAFGERPSDTLKHRK